MMPTQVGPYAIHEKLGSGGMGTVYLGRHNETGMVAAVKVLPASMAQEEGFVERFAREIDSMKRLSNKHIVALYESGVDGGTYYYAMEYVPGDNLTTLLRRQKRMPWQQAVDIAIQICHALKAAHDAGIIHRDLKPSNLMLTPDGTVKLTDFGVAQVFASGRLTVTGGIVGTAEFMSPEQAQGKRANKQSDLYSLGAVLYALVTGRPPFSGPTAVDVLHKHKFGQFDKARTIVPEIPSWLDDVISQLLEKDPAKRFPNAFVLSRRLQEIVKKVELAEDQTIAETGDSGEGSATPAAPGLMDGPGPATMMQNLVRAELEEMQQPTWLGTWFNNAWVLVGLLLLVVAGGVLWFRDHELTPEQQFEAGMALLRQPEGGNWERARDVYFQPLLQSDPEHWRDRLAEPLQTIDAYVARRKAGLHGLGRRVRSGTESESERFLRLASGYRKAGDFAQAERTLIALIAILENDEQQKDLYTICKEELQQWRVAEAAEPGRFDWVKAALQRADEFAEAGKIADARKIWISIKDLYGDDSDAHEYVSQANQHLEQDLVQGP